MKILRKRNKIKCDYCKSVIKYQPDDVELNYTKVSKTQIKDYYSYIFCPVCKGMIVLSDVNDIDNYYKKK